MPQRLAYCCITSRFWLEKIRLMKSTKSLNFPWRLWALLVALLPVCSVAAWAQSATAPTVNIAAGGKALLEVVVAKDSLPSTREVAGDLATYLGKISGATFKVVDGDGRTGIAVGTAADFKALPFAAELPVRDVADRERYLLRTHAAGIFIVAATDKGVSHGVWDLLGRLGYRQFFPGANWEVIPKTPQLSIAVAAMEKPDYANRRIWYGFGGWDYAAAPYARWQARNRMGSSFDLRTGHAYDSIISDNAETFEAHPEYFGLVKGERLSTKMCIGNPKLRAFVAERAVEYFTANPTAHTVSMEPSDGGGWCECEQCAKLGNITDRAITLANAVAAAVTAKFPDKYVGMYAYSQHGAPPTIAVHPHVIVSIATSFLRGYTADQLFEGWGKTGIQLGVREYYSVNTWDRDLPGRARGGHLPYLKETLPKFHRFGARFLSAESSDNWGPNGLGYYLASRISWDVDEAAKADAIVEDFLTKAFGPAKEPMRQFYQLIDSSKKPVLTADLVGNMYRRLKEARDKTTDAAIRARINDLILYIRYVELFRAYSTNRDAARQTAFENMIKHAYRMRRTMMVHTKALYRDLPERDGSVRVPRSATWMMPGGPDDVVEAEETAAEVEGEEPPTAEEGEDAAGEGEGGEGGEAKATEAKPATPAKGKAPKPRKTPAKVEPEIEEEDLALALKEGEKPVMAEAVPKFNMWKSSIPYEPEEYTAFLDEGIKANSVQDYVPVNFGTDLVPATPLKFDAVTMPPKFVLAMRNRKTLYTWVETAPGKVGVEVMGGLIAGYRYRGTTKISLLTGGAPATPDPNAKPEAATEIQSDGVAYPVEVKTTQRGLHRLVLDDRAMKLRLSWDDATPLTFVPTMDMSVGFGGATMYFYVPRGTKVLGGLGRGSGDIFDSTGAKRYSFVNSNDYFSVPVPAGTDGTIWTAKLGGDVLLETVPPSLAFNPAQLLLPRAVVEKDKK